MTPDGMDRLVELLDSAIGYIGIDQPELVETLAEARAVVVRRAAEERAELAAELAGMDPPDVGREVAVTEGRLVTQAPVADREYPLTPEGIRAALEEVLAYHHDVSAGREADRGRYEMATGFLAGLPSLPGALGLAVADVIRPVDGSELVGSLAEVARSLGSAPPLPGEQRAVRAVGSDALAQLQEARDGALDRAIRATLRQAGHDAGAGADPAATADASSWAGVHQRAVEALAQAGAAESPRLVPSRNRPGLGRAPEEAVTTDVRPPAFGPRSPDVDPWW